MTIFNRQFSTWQIATLGLTLLALLISIQVTFFIQQQRQVSISRIQIQESYKQMLEVRSLFSKLKDAETGQRGYLLTGDKRFLGPYLLVTGQPFEENSVPLNKDRRTVQDILHSVKSMFSQEDTHQMQHVNELEELVLKELDYLAMTIKIYDEKGENTALSIIRRGDGKVIMDQIRVLVYDMIELEDDELRQLLIHDKNSGRRLTIYIVAATCVTYFSLLITILLITVFFSRSRRVEKKLHAREAWFRAAANGSMDGFFLFRAVHGPDGQVNNMILDYMNPVAETMTKKTMASMLARPIDDVLFPEDKMDAVCRSRYYAVYQEQTASQNEYTVASGPMAGHTFQQQAIPLPSGIAVTCRDVTERRQIEQMKNEFVSTVSHELRTPLTSIRGSLGLVTGGVAGELPDAIKSLLTIAYNNCERLVRLINDILDIEKIEAGKVIFDMKPLDILRVTEHAVIDNQAFAEKYGVSIRMVRGTPATVVADEDRLLQVLTNLLSNAVKFSPSGGSVTIRSGREEDNIRIDVTDEGPGIDKEFQDKIFQKFAQADSSDTRQKNGTGLGLTITKAIIEQMHGSVSFVTSPEKGTTFSVMFPLSDAEHDHAPDIRHENTDGKPTILVCEDDVDIANLLSLIMEKAGFVVDIAHTAQSAFKMLSERNYAAMTLDLILPDKENSTFRDGLHFIKKLRSDKRFETLPIVVVSAKAEEGQIEIVSGDAVGILDWMPKPIHADRLIQLVKNLPVENGRPHILHVEDDNDIAQILSMSLQPYADVVRATSVKQAKAKLHTHRYDLVILDIGLPDGVGTELLPFLSDENGQTTPVVLFTASDVTQDISKRVAATLVKSRTSEDKLLETIRQMIAHHDPTSPDTEKE